MDKSTDETCTGKVGRNINRYDIDDLNNDLRRERFDNAASLRELADHANRLILEKAISKESIDLTDVAYGAVSPDDALGAIYETLTSDDVAADREAHVRKRLEQRGLDIETIESDWVTHPTIRSHLNDRLGIDTSRSAHITPDDSNDTIEWARTRCNQIVEQTISRLVSSGFVSISDFEVSVDIHVKCVDCGRTYRPAELLKQRSCDCSKDETVMVGQ